MSEIHLIQQYYVPEHRDRRAELETCLKRNLANPHVSCVHLLNEREHDVAPFDSTHGRFRQVIVDRRLTFRMAFEYANRHLRDRICILSNADIYFDDTLSLLHGKPLERTVLTLLRYDVKENGSAELFGPRSDSQDAWIFRAPIPAPEACDIEVGRWGSDNKVAYVLEQEGLELSNPCLTIRSYHLHLSNFRPNLSYGWSLLKRKRSKKKDGIVPPPYRYVEPCTFG